MNIISSPSRTLPNKNPRYQQLIVKIGILFLLLCFTVLQLFATDDRDLGGQIAFLWPRFNLLLVVAQGLCLLVLCRSAIFRMRNARRMPWILLIAVPLCLANVFLFKLHANIESYIPDDYNFEYRLLHNGRIYSLVEARLWLGCNQLLSPDRKHAGYMCGYYNLYDCDLLEFTCYKVDLGSIAPKQPEYGTSAVPAYGEPYAYGAPRPYPILRATGASVQVVSDVNELGEYIPQGIPIYTFTPFMLPSASLIIVFILLGMTGYAIKTCWNIERA